MRLTFPFALVLSTFAALVAAQSNDKSNAFDIPPAGFLLHAGQPQTFTWHNKAGNTVTLTLRNGPNGNLNKGTVIKSEFFHVLQLEGRGDRRHEKLTILSSLYSRSPKHRLLHLERASQYR